MNIAYIEETEWMGCKVHEINGFKYWYSGGTRATNGVGILVDKELTD